MNTLATEGLAACSAFALQHRHYPSALLSGGAMSREFDTYADGYANGKKDTLGGMLAQVTMGMLRDDPGGFYTAGYRDGSAGKKFSPPAPTVKQPAAKAATPSAPASDLEKSWYRLCNSSEFISKEVADWFIEQLNATGKHVAIVVGLDDFMDASCPQCSSVGQFKIHFLGRLNHPGCRSSYMGTFSYAAFQLAQVLHTGIRAGGSMKDESDRKGERGGWIHALFGFCS
jgi:hypothetical protein